MEEEKDKKGFTGRDFGSKTIPILGELESRTKEGITAAAGTIYDYAKEKFQQTINEEYGQQIESLSNSFAEVVQDDIIPRLAETEEKVDNNIPYIIVYENQYVNIPCDAYGNCLDDSSNIETKVKLYHGNIVENLAETNGIIVDSQGSEYQYILDEQSGDNSFASLSILGSNVKFLQDLTEIDFHLVGESETIVYGKIFFNKVKQGKSAFEEWKDAHPEIENPTITRFLAELKNTDSINGPKYAPDVVSAIEDLTIYFIPNSDPTKFDIWLREDSNTITRLAKEIPGDITNYAGIYDVSEDNLDGSNNPTEYSTLSAAIDDIAETAKKGGMTIKYIGTDGKYHQYRYTRNTISDAYFNNEFNWETIESIKNKFVEEKEFLSFDHTVTTNTNTFRPLGLKGGKVYRIHAERTEDDSSGIGIWMSKVNSGNTQGNLIRIGSFIPGERTCDEYFRADAAYPYLCTWTLGTGGIISVNIYECNEASKVPQSANDIAYNNAVSNLNATNIQEALDSFAPIIHTDVRDISYADGSLIQGIQLSGGKWNTQSDRKFYMFNYTYKQGDMLHIEPNNLRSAYYNFLTSNDTPVVGNDAPLCTPRLIGWIEASSALDVPIPATCVCIIINEAYSTDSFRPSVLQIRNSSVPNIDSVLDSLDNKIDGLTVLNTFDLSSYPKRNCYFDINKWIIGQGNKGAHKAISVTSGHYYRLIGSTGSFIAWLSSSYNPDINPTANEDCPYALGTTRSWVTPNKIIQAPRGASYLAVMVENYQGTQYNVTKIEEVNAYKEKINDSLDYFGEISDKWEVVDLSQYTPAAKILNGRGNNTWFSDQKVRTHIAIEVTPGDVYILRSARWIIYGLLKTYDTSSAPDYCESAPYRVEKSAGTYKIVIPSDCHYIVFSHTSNDSYYLPDLLCKPKVLSWALDKMKEEADGSGNFYPQKITYAHWNVGHFAYWNAALIEDYPNELFYNTRIAAQDSPAMLKKYRNIINKVGADIISICEYEPYFDKGNSLTKDVLFGNYKYQFIGHKDSYSCNSIFSNLKGNAHLEQEYSHQVTYNNTMDMYFKSAIIKIGNVDVAVVETHLDWDDENHWQQRPYTNTLQMEQLINTFSSYDHVIISGDFNVETLGEYQPFVDAGFTLVSGSYVELSSYARYLANGTHLETNTHLDNILVKGFVVTNAKVWEESGYYRGSHAKYILSISGSASGTLRIAVNSMVDGSGRNPDNISEASIEISNSDTPDEIAVKIKDGLSIQGWNISAFSHYVIIECNEVGKNRIEIVHNALNSAVTNYIDPNGGTIPKIGIKIYGTDIPAIEGTDFGLSDHSLISCDLLIQK